MRKRKFRELIENNRWLKKVPNLLTICNSLCGFAAVLYALHLYDDTMLATHPLKVSAWIIMFAMVFDALDGFAARIFHAGSMKGLQMDSLADMVTFGMAPAVVVAIMAHYNRSSGMFQPYEYFVMWGLCGVYLGCAASRLATYNVEAIFPHKDHDSNYFSGLPSPGGAAAICSTVIFFCNFPGEIKYLTYGLPLYAATLGLLMVSRIPYIHVGRWLQSVRRNKKRMAVLIVVLVAAVCRVDVTIIVIVNLYIFSGPVMVILSRTGVVPPRESKPLPESSESAH